MWESICITEETSLDKTKNAGTSAKNIFGQVVCDLIGLTWHLTIPYKTLSVVWVYYMWEIMVQNCKKIFHQSADKLYKSFLEAFLNCMRDPLSTFQLTFDVQLFHSRTQNQQQVQWDLHMTIDTSKTAKDKNIDSHVAIDFHLPLVRLLHQSVNELFC